VKENEPCKECYVGPYLYSKIVILINLEAMQSISSLD